MWDYLVGFSTWAESNSGQIQILIAIGAIGLAFAGYKRVLEQIHISTKQEDQANKQRGYELKIQALSLLLTASDRNHATLKSLYEIVEHLEKPIEGFEGIKSKNIQELQRIIQSTRKKIAQIKELQDLIVRLCDEINKREVIDQRVIKLLYEALFSAMKESYNYELLKQNLVEV